MKYIKKFNEELDPSTYLRASNKLSKPSQSTHSIKRELVNMSSSDIITLGKIKMDMKEFNPGYHEKKTPTTLKDRIISFGYLGVGKWDNGKLDDGERMIMKYLKDFECYLNESTESEINRILDKISKYGLESLTKDEKSKLDNFSGEYDKPKSDEEFSFDKDGNILINGVPYSQYNLNKDKKKDTPNTEKKKDTPLTSNYQKLKSNYEDYEILNKDDDNVVVVKVSGSYRNYFIYFKSIDVQERFSVIKMVYNTNSRRDNPFKVYDNYDNELDFNKMDVYLNSVGLNFGDFNRAWYYVEEHYINQGYH